jgi:hypothetical protein
MSKATEAALAELHGVVAEALTGALRPGVLETETGTINVAPSAAHIMAAITFLKNNNITADASSNAALTELSDSLQKMRSKGKRTLNPQVLKDVAEQLDRDLGGDTSGLMQ